MRPQRSPLPPSSPGLATTSTCRFSAKPRFFLTSDLAQHKRKSHTDLVVQVPSKLGQTGVCAFPIPSLQL